MMKLHRTTSDNQDFINLVALLDADLAERDGEEHAFYHQFNSIQELKHALVVYENDIAIGCGAVKQFDSYTMEVKRMYVLPDYRGRSIATTLLAALEQWTLELGYTRCILETGKRQPEAIALYRKNGYKVIPNYGQYAGIENSVCFEKTVSF
ncbi:GNAT family N-acetyltransferase [Aggregatimonas sangjinii]|uniref:GNAT family N-acetyltransferase n=1 Tax=Aggregatimonas sangjinii TaxID=2583587 RepID=A0A5B7SNW0_9FLAO|nr:GNAT family N-acetyltransferase [Aggregatimonas sangjinii]QCX00266.1 GNAT family N-acetyltransferase [Aggregatimonas sangjinii]